MAPSVFMPWTKKENVNVGDLVKVVAGSAFSECLGFVVDVDSFEFGTCLLVLVSWPERPPTSWHPGCRLLFGFDEFEKVS